MAIVAVLMSGCTPRLGYIPHDVYAGGLFSDSHVPKTTPPYADVKQWAYDVSDGYDSRATFNRQAMNTGGLLALASVSAMAGLGAFAPGSAAIVAIPIGTGLVSGTLALYNNDKKALIYGFGSTAIRNAAITSDCRGAFINESREDAATYPPPSAVSAAPGATPGPRDSAPVDARPDDNYLAGCLHRDVSNVVSKVDEQIAALDPTNVAQLNEGVRNSAAAEEAKAAQAQLSAERADKKVAAILKENGGDQTTAAYLAAVEAKTNADKAAAAASTKASDETNKAVIQILFRGTENPATLQDIPSSCWVPKSCPPVTALLETPEATKPTAVAATPDPH
ncbi:MAG: hypothetical protein ABI629_02365 [bacterium]